MSRLHETKADRDQRKRRADDLRDIIAAARIKALKEAARLVCASCRTGVERLPLPSGKHFVSGIGTAECKAFRIWEVISSVEGAEKEP